MRNDAPEKEEIAFSSLNRDQKSPRRRPTVTEIGQFFRLRSTIRTLFYV